MILWMFLWLVCRMNMDELDDIDEYLDGSEEEG